MPGGGQERSKRWCFTFNNYTENDCDTIRGLSASNDVVCLSVGREVGTNGTRHLQGYLELDRPRRMGGVKTLLGSNTVHLEVARGSREQNVQYTSKEGDVLASIIGPDQDPGKRNDLLALQEAIRNSTPIVEYADSSPSNLGVVLKYYRGIEWLQAKRVPARNFRTQCVWFYGTTGSGKTRRAHEESQALCPSSVWWSPDSSLKWFDGYAGHKGVIIDEFSGGAELPKLLQLLDRYPCRVAVKGSFVEWAPRIVWITSQYEPYRYYGTEGEQFRALLRRMDELIDIGTDPSKNILSEQ